MNGVLWYMNFRLRQGQAGNGGPVGHPLSGWYYHLELGTFVLVAGCWKLHFCISQGFLVVSDRNAQLSNCKEISWLLQLIGPV